MSYLDFINKHAEVLDKYWIGISHEVLRWKLSYEWPRGRSLQESIAKRNQLEHMLRTEAAANGCLSKTVFDEVMVWGFGRPSNNVDMEVRTASKKAVDCLKSDDLDGAAYAITSLPGIGISRGSKILSLLDQDNIGIYDSRAAHGLSDLAVNDRRLILSPPGRVVPGDTGLSRQMFCKAFKEYNWVLRYLRDRMLKDSTLSREFPRVSDVEMAFFARSRNFMLLDESGRKCSYGQQQAANEAVPEGDKYWTLGAGDKAKPFWAYIDEAGVSILTGSEGKTVLNLSHKEVDKCLEHFSNKGWFLLGNAVDNVKEGGLGEYFKLKLKIGAKFASHFAAMMVIQRRLEYCYGSHNRVELRVKAVSRVEKIILSE